MSHKVDITLLGKTFSIRTEDDPDDVKAAVTLVQNQLDELRSMGSTLSTDRLMTLTALNLAGELLKKDGAQIQNMDAVLSALDDAVLQAEGLAKVPLR